MRAGDESELRRLPHHEVPIERAGHGDRHGLAWKVRERQDAVGVWEVSREPDDLVEHRAGIGADDLDGEPVDLFGRGEVGRHLQYDRGALGASGEHERTRDEAHLHSASLPEPSVVPGKITRSVPKTMPSVAAAPPAT